MGAKGFIVVAGGNKRKQTLTLESNCVVVYEKYI